jgi:polynucleotide 5'-kinase involved in rRNA processing
LTRLRGRLSRSKLAREYGRVVVGEWLAATHGRGLLWLPRQARALVDEAMADTRVVLVNGARQSGKSTLVRLVAAGVDA